MKEKFEQLNRKLTKSEMDLILSNFSNHPLFKPLIEDARIKMASRDYGFRKVFHDSLKNYISTVSQSDFERFLGDKSKALEKRIDENIDVFKRLKNR